MSAHRAALHVTNALRLDFATPVEHEAFRMALIYAASTS